MKSVVSSAAQADLQEIVDFIAADNPDAAESWLSAMQAKFHEIGRHPLIYPVREDLVPGMRLCAQGAYNIYFQVRLDEVFFARVLHSARDPAKQTF